MGVSSGDVWDFFVGKAQIEEGTACRSDPSRSQRQGSEDNNTTVVMNSEGGHSRGAASGDNNIKPVFAINESELFSAGLPGDSGGGVDIFSRGRAVLYTGAGLRFHRQALPGSQR